MIRVVSSPVPAVLLGNGYPEPAAIGERLVELGGELVRRVLLQPVLVVELGGQLGDRPADRRLVLGELKVHRERSFLASLVR